MKIITHNLIDLSTPQSHSRRGFTLLEVILAMSLSVILLAALYSAVNIHLRIAEEGPRVMDRTQIARGLLNRIARDISAMVPPDSDSSTTAESTSTEEGVEEELPSAYVTQSGMIGGPDWIMFYTVRQLPNVDDIEMAALSGYVGIASNIRRISYSLEQLPVQSGESVKLAISRTDVAGVLAERFDSSQDTTAQRAAMDYLAEDVGTLQFLYWDDVSQAWLDTWGETEPIAPPKAIKVTVSLQSAQEYLQMEAGMEVRSTWDPVYDLVIPIRTNTTTSEEVLQ